MSASYPEVIKGIAIFINHSPLHNYKVIPVGYHSNTINFTIKFLPVYCFNTQTKSFNPKESKITLVLIISPLNLHDQQLNLSRCLDINMPSRCVDMLESFDADVVLYM